MRPATRVPEIFIDVTQHLVPNLRQDGRRGLLERRSHAGGEGRDLFASRAGEFSKRARDVIHECHAAGITSKIYRCEVGVAGDYFDDSEGRRRGSKPRRMGREFPAPFFAGENGRRNERPYRGMR